MHVSHVPSTTLNFSISLFFAKIACLITTTRHICLFITSLCINMAVLWCNNKVHMTHLEIVWSFRCLIKLTSFFLHQRWTFKHHLFINDFSRSSEDNWILYRNRVSECPYSFICRALMYAVYYFAFVMIQKSSRKAKSRCWNDQLKTIMLKIL